jgi:hypothetical protein
MQVKIKEIIETKVMNIRENKRFAPGPERRVPHDFCKTLYGNVLRFTRFDLLGITVCIQNLYWATGKRGNEVFAVAFCEEPGIEEGDDSRIILRPDQTADSLFQFQNRFGECKLKE